MDITKSNCGCKGVRSCLICEKAPGNKRTVGSRYDKPEEVMYFCTLCNKAWPQSQQRHTHHISSADGDAVDFPGVVIVEDFVSEDEESEIVRKIDESEWKVSQSGRWKQDYGPKVNFKKQKVNHTVFTGLPSFSETLLNRMNQFDCVKNFPVVEQCNLEYHPERGSSIDPHFDDFWLWGERLVTVNLLSDTVLSMTKPDSNLCVDISLPRRSLIVLFGPARFEWLHAIHREAITSRRIAITFRELSTEFSEGGPKADVGSRLIDIARNFSGTVVS